MPRSVISCCSPSASTSVNTQIRSRPASVLFIALPSPGMSDRLRAVHVGGHVSVGAGRVCSPVHVMSPCDGSGPWVILRKRSHVAVVDEIGPWVAHDPDGEPSQLASCQ